MTPDDLREALKIARDDAMEQVEALIESEAPDGETWDVLKITDPREFIAAYIDLTQRPSPEFSIMDFLPQIGDGAVYKMLTTRFEREYAKLTGA